MKIFNNAAVKIAGYIFVTVITIAFLLIMFFFGRLFLNYKNYRLTEIVIDTELPRLTGYTSKPSVAIGQAIEVFVHADAAYTAELIRANDKSAKVICAVAASRTLQSPTYSLRFGHDWTTPLSIPTRDLEPGLYIVRLRSAASDVEPFNVPVILRSSQPHQLVVVSPTNTWQAYNDYGGISNYRDYVTPPDLYMVFEFLKQFDPGLIPGTYLPNERPYNHPICHTRAYDSMRYLNGKLSADLHLIDFLDDGEHSYDLISDLDFEKGIGLDSAKLVIFHNHSEYWSYEAMGILKNSISEGVDIAFLSGNNMFRRVESEAGNTLVVKAQGIPRSTAEPIIGTHYSLSGYQEAYGSYRVRKEDHWVFTNTNLANGDVFGADLISGIETDKLGPFSEGFELLAIGTSTNGPGHMVIKEFDRGNYLFNSSSILSVQALRVDPAWGTMVENLIERSM